MKPGLFKHSGSAAPAYVLLPVNVLWFPGSPLILKLLLRLRKFTQGQSEHSYNRSLDRRIMCTLIITNIMFSSARLCKRIVGLSRHRTIATVPYFYELVLWFWIRNGYPWSNKFALFVRKRFLETYLFICLHMTSLRSINIKSNITLMLA